MKLDLKSNTRKLRERLESETDTILRRNIITVIRHIEGEIANKVDITMSTMIKEPAIRCFFSSLVGRYEPDAAPRPGSTDRCMAIEGGAAVKAMYDFVCGQRMVWSHFDVEHLVVDRHCIVQIGMWHVPTTGAGLKELGRTVDDENALYLGVGRMVVVFPFDAQSGLLLGEDIYVDPAILDAAEKRKISPSDYLPNYERIVELSEA